MTGRTTSRRWPERFSVAALIAAAIAILLFGAVLSPIAFIIAAVMGYSRGFEEVAAKGKRTLSGTGRAVIGGMMVVIGVALLPVATERAATTAQPEPQPTPTVKQSAAEVQAKLSRLLDAERQLAREDVEGRLFAWKEITALAPDNAEYARKRKELEDRVVALKEAVENPEQATVVEEVKARKEGFGNILMIDVTLRNDSLSNLKDFIITCDSKGASGTVIDRNTRTLYEVVEARSSRKFRNINMGLLHSQAKSTDCDVIRASIG